MAIDDKNSLSRRGELLWIIPAIAILLLLGFATSGKDVASSIGRTIGYNVVTIAMTVGAFFLTDFLTNKTLARLFYVILFAGIVYWFYTPR